MPAAEWACCRFAFAAADQANAALASMAMVPPGVRAHTSHAAARRSLGPPGRRERCRTGGAGAHAEGVDRTPSIVVADAVGKADLRERSVHDEARIALHLHGVDAVVV